jgi:uncharacterized phage protein (TIGR01671 family)
MRSREEIKFRGLSKRNKTYVYGSYWLNPFTKQDFIRTLCEGGTQLEDIECLVVEQFTGLVDVNGKQVFEGDIVKFTRNAGNWQIPNASYELSNICEVIYDNSTCRFALKYNGNIQKLRVFSRYKYEVIGNIHENKDLLV